MDFASHWTLDPAISYLNHGSFGACPRPVLEHQNHLRAELESQPMAFMAGLERRLDEARRVVADFVGADAEDLAFVINATTGVNAVLGSLALAPGDEILTTNHVYNACRNAMRLVAQSQGARYVEVNLPLPVGSDDEVVAAVVNAVGKRTRLALIDHVTSASGLILPIERLIRALAGQGIDVLVDGAHAPGMVPVDLRALTRAGAVFYVGNLHKWCCAPKSVGFLHVRRDRQDAIRSPITSHGVFAERHDRSRFLCDFDWPGTYDPTAILSVPAALSFLGGLLPGGWPALMARNRDLVLRGRDIIAEALALEPIAPDPMIGSMAALRLPDGTHTRGCTDPLQDELLAATSIQTMIPYFPAPPHRLLRLSAQAYNREEEYVALGQALTRYLARQSV